MVRLRKIWKVSVAAVTAIVALQVGASLLVRTHRVHDRLELQLSRAFGRSVQVRHFDAQVLPMPTLGAEAITVGEDPAFGNEYFLRADAMSAGLRWLGLLRGRLELGTISLSRPSLILVRSAEGRWNLERWLPPARRSPAIYGPLAPAGRANRLRRIEFEEGRVNFKLRDDKVPFAFTNVSGAVEQVSPGRWRLQLEATPWRSGIALQLPGVLRVQGDIAGTSARLQPARVQIHWGNASLADVLRLWRGQDFGVRGSFAIDAGLESLGANSAQTTQPSAWDFTLHARADGLHRWDLGERSDNPRISLRTSGKWFSDTRAIAAADFRLEAPQSNVVGNFSYGGHTGEGVNLHAESIAVQASDMLGLYRAFHAGVADGLTVRQFLSGRLAVHDWPPRVDEFELASLGGTVRIPGIDSPIRIGAAHIVGDSQSLALDPVVLSWPSSSGPKSREAAKSEGERRANREPENSVTLGGGLDLASRAGSFTVSGQTGEAAQILRIAQAFGKPLQYGWELSGAASAALRWQWKGGSLPGTWNGSVNVFDARLQAAGLNLPVILNDARLMYIDGRRRAEIREAHAFGAKWNGTVDEPADKSARPPRWRFTLSAGRLDAAELDRWVGPRARPNWLQRLLQSMLGGGTASASASDLLRRVNAEGELNIDELTVGKLQLQNVHAPARIHDLYLELHDAEARWAGGALRASFNAAFTPHPGYEMTAQLERVNLAQLPGGLPERVSGVLGGSIRLSASGIGRNTLLESLAGDGELALRNVEFRGWDLAASLTDGAAHSGISRWSSGKCAFHLSDQSATVRSLQLENGKESMLVSGRITLAPKLELALQSNWTNRVKSAGSVRVLKISGPLDKPRLSIENAQASPAD